jgi:hypothetical protein
VGKDGYGVWVVFHDCENLVLLQCPFGIWEIWGELQSKISQLKDLWPSVNPYCMVRKQEIKEETSSGMKAQCRGGDLII